MINFSCFKIKYFIYFIFYLLQSSQDFTNPAFEPEDGYVDDHQFCDIVDQVLRQPLNGGRYVHPYGQGNLYKAILVGEKTKLPQSAGKLVFWAVFMLMMVGLACSIIILAGDHKKGCIQSRLSCVIYRSRLVPDFILRSPNRYRATYTLHVSSGNSLITNTAFLYVHILDGSLY